MTIPATPENLALQKKKESIIDEVFDEAEAKGYDTTEYLALHENDSCLDGWFTPKELRTIADMMEEISKRLKEAGIK